MPLALAMAADPPTEAREPGAPVPKDEIDPELVSLRPRTQVGLLTSFSVVVFCIYMAVRLWPDLKFSREDKPRAIDVASVVAGKADRDSYLGVRLDLERAAAVRVRQSAGVPGLRIAPVIGSGDKLWVALDGDGWAAPRRDGTYVGRLKKLSDLPFDEPLRSHVAANPSPRFVTPAALQTTGGTSFEDVSGATFTAQPTDDVEVVVMDPDAVTVIGSFGSRVPDAEAWTTQLNGAFASGGVADYHVELRRQDSHQAWFDVRYPGAAVTSPKLLERAQLWGGRVEPITRQYRGDLSDVRVTDSVITIGDQDLPRVSVDVVAIHAQRRIPGDPWVLIAGDEPRTYWYLTWIYGLVVLFGLLFTWALVRTARRELFAPKVPTRA